MENLKVMNPDQQVIHNLLAYSKALEVLKRPYEKGKKRTSFRLILN